METLQSDDADCRATEINHFHALVHEGPEMSVFPQCIFLSDCNVRRHGTQCVRLQLRVRRSQVHMYIGTFDDYPVAGELDKFHQECIPVLLQARWLPCATVHTNYKWHQFWMVLIW